MHFSQFQIKISEFLFIHRNYVQFKASGFYNKLFDFPLWGTFGHPTLAAQG